MFTNKNKQINYVSTLKVYQYFDAVCKNEDLLVIASIWNENKRITIRMIDRVLM